MKSQADFPIKETILHKELDRIHDRAFIGAWNALQAYNDQFTILGRELKHRNYQLNRGQYEGAKSTQTRIKQLQQMRK